ncbi:hypothetical protein NOCARDAX2BIS_470018 [Nocardioides sp. AX2bis]|nr:hypothetical protein NOCARDAX2BIS_470018 [Nocardioides sp. AX2bis]
MPARRSAPPAARASAPGARPSGSWPASPTTAPTRAPPRATPAWSASGSPASAAGPRPTATRRSRRGRTPACRRSPRSPSRRPRSPTTPWPPRPRSRPTARPTPPQPRRATRRERDQHPDPGPHRRLGRRAQLDPGDLRGPRRLPRPRRRPGHGAPRRGRGRQGLRPARTRRRRVPDRDEVELHPPGQPQAEVPRGQRRRVRAGHLQGHPADDGQPPPAGGGRDHLQLRHPGPPRLHLHPRRDPPRRAARAEGGAGGLPRRPPRQGHPRVRLRPRRRGPHRRRRLHLRRGDGAAGGPRGPPRPAPPAPAVPGRRRAVRQPHRDQQRRVDRLGAEHHRPRRRLVRLHGHREVPGLRDLLPLRARAPPRAVRGPARDHPASADRPRRRHPRGPRAEVLDPRRLQHADPDRRAPRRPAGLRGRRRCRVDAGHPGAAGLRRDHLRAAGGAALDRVLQARVLRQVHPVPRGHLVAGADPRPARGRSGLPRGPRPAARPVRQHPGPLVLRARRRGDQPHLQLDPALPRRVPRPPRARRLPVRPGRLHPVRRRRGAGHHRSLSHDHHAREGPARPAHRPGHRHHRRRPDQRAEGHPGDPGRRAGRHPDPALLRPPAAGARRRLPPVPGRGPRRRQRAGHAQAAGLVHAAGRRGHGRQHPGHQPGRRQGPAGRDGVPAGQPPAGLPRLRQGRGVPAAEPGDVQRPRGVPLLRLGRGQADLPQADQHLRQRAARPGALRALCPLHPLLRADRGRPLHRAGRARRAAAGRHLREGAAAVVLLGQHHPDLPGGRADLRGVPLPLAALRPRLHPGRR